MTIDKKKWNIWSLLNDAKKKTDERSWMTRKEKNNNSIYESAEVEENDDRSWMMRSEKKNNRWTLLDDALRKTK